MSKDVFAWGALILFAGITGWLGYRGYRRTRSVEGFAVGNRDMSPIFVGLALAAQLTSVATFVVNPGLVFAYGTAAIVGMGFAASMGITIGLVVLSKGFRASGEKLAALTVPGWLGSRYKSGGMQIGFALLSLALISFMVLIVVAMAYVVAQMLGVPAWAAMAGVIVWVFAYVLLGGANTSVYTNSVQAGIMVVVALLLIGSGRSFLSGGIEPFLDRLAGIDAALVGLVNSKSPYFRNLFEVLLCNFVVGLALVCQPHVMGKALSLRSGRDVNRYLITAIAVGTIFAGVLVIGLFARATLPAATRIDLAVPLFINTQFSPIMGVIIAIGVLCAGMSTLEGLLLALSAILSLDLFLPVLRARGKYRSPEEQGRLALRLARLSLLVIGGVAFVLGLHQMHNPTGGSVAIFAQYGLYCLFSASFAPMLFGMFTQRARARTAQLSAVTAVVVYVGMSVFKITPLHNNPAVLSACAIFASTAVMVAGHAWDVLSERSAKRRIAQGWSKPEIRSI